MDGKNQEAMRMKKVILVRGIPGAGKSTYVRKLRAEHEALGYEVVTCSADDFFIHEVWKQVSNTEAGILHNKVMEYQFDPAKLAEAHSACLGGFLDAVQEADDGDQLVIVDNTFIHKWEMRNYIKAANFADCVVEVHEFRVETIMQLRLCVERNEHKVPADVVARMAMEFEPYDGAVVVPLGGAS